MTWFYTLEVSGLRAVLRILGKNCTVHFPAACHAVSRTGLDIPAYKYDKVHTGNGRPLRPRRPWRTKLYRSWIFRVLSAPPSTGSGTPAHHFTARSDTLVCCFRRMQAPGAAQAKVNVSITSGTPLKLQPWCVL